MLYFGFMKYLLLIAFPISLRSSGLRFLLLFLLCSNCLLPAACCFAQLPDCDIWLFNIKDSAEKTYFSNPENITHRKGYDNQPAFSPDGKYLLYSSQPDSIGQIDIYKYEFATKKITQFTKTPTSEFSPTFMPDPRLNNEVGQGKNISIVMVENDKDSVQRLWQFPLSPLQGGDTKCGGCACIMKNVDSIGYHCWINKDSVAVFILTKPSFTLQLVNIHSQKATIVADSIGRCMRMRGKALWFTVKSGHFNSVYEYSPGSNSAFLKGIIESEDYCFHAKDQIWSFSDNAIVLGYMNSKAGASEVIDLEKYGITKPSRIAISPDGKKMAVVSNK